MTVVTHAPALQETNMITHFLTKSDFKVAQTCPTKLYYRKLGYPTREDGDEY